MIAELLAAATWTLALCVGLHLSLSRRPRAWLVACFVSSFLYVVLSLQLERTDAGWWLEGLRWGLFATALFTFVRYWLARRRS